MEKFKISVILMGVDWSKAAKLIAKRDISKCMSPEISNIVNDLDYYYRKKRNL
tara:strand:+ start:577 stop:735 length:159 start_codon:yes stop_codon:yes gene_type:complete